MSKKIWNQEKDRFGEIFGADYLLCNRFISKFIDRPSNLTLSLFREIFSYEGSIGSAYRDLGFEVEQFDSEKYLVLFGSKAFLNLREEEKAIYAEVGLRYFSKGEQKYLKADSIFSLSFINRYRYQRRIKNIASEFDLYLDEANRFLSDQRVESYRVDVETTDLASILDELENVKNLFRAEFTIYYRHLLAKLCYQSIVQKGMKSDFLRYLRRTQEYYTYGNEMMNSVRGKSEIDQEKFIDKYGHRAFGMDFELSAIRWSEDSARAINLYVERNAHPDTIPYLSDNLTPIILAKIRDRDIRSIVKLNSMNLYLDNIVFYLIKRIESMRKLLLRVDELLDLGGEVFNFSFDQVLASRNTSLLPSNTQKPISIDNLPTIIHARTRYPEIDERRVAVAYISGTNVSPGSAEGILRIVESPEQSVEPGEVIVVRSQSRDLIESYISASGIVFLSGGLLSEGSYFARTLNKPALISDRYDTLQSWEGRRVLLNASEGKISLV